MFDRTSFDEAIARVAERYERTAPTVDTWCDWLCLAGDAEITLADVHLLMQLDAPEPMQPNYAANLLYKMQSRLGRDTTGQAGF